VDKANTTHNRTVAELRFTDELLTLPADKLAGWKVDPEETNWPNYAIGPCPRCDHSTKSELHYGAVVRGMTGTAPPPEQRLTALLSCDCDVPHPDAASQGTSHKGCGCKWVATITLDPQLQPRVRPMVDAKLLSAAADWDEFVSTQEPSFRAQAEKWAGAVAALLGLYGLAAFITSKDAFIGLPLWARAVAAGIVVLGFAAGVAAVYWSNRAAYGWPELAQVRNDSDLAKWHEARKDQLRVGADRMKWAVRLAVISLALLMAAAALLWVAPRQTDKANATPSPVACAPR
jgi:hypothetical protein